MRFSPVSSIIARRVTVTTAGTPVQGSDINVPAGIPVIVRAHPQNQGNIYVASTSADALSSSSNNVPLAPDQAVSFLVGNFDALWFDADQNTDKVILTAGFDAGSVGFTRYQGYESKQFTISGAQTDYNVATQQSLFARTMRRVRVLSNIASVVKINSASANSINIAAGEEVTIDDLGVSNLYITTTADTIIRIVSFV